MDWFLCNLGSRFLKQKKTWEDSIQHCWGDGFWMNYLGGQMGEDSQKPTSLRTKLVKPNSQLFKLYKQYVWRYERQIHQTDLISGWKGQLILWLIKNKTVPVKMEAMLNLAKWNIIGIKCWIQWSLYKYEFPVKTSAQFYEI